MSNLAIIHQYHFGDIRDQVFRLLEQIFSSQYIRTLPAGNLFFAARVGEIDSKNDCKLVAVLLENGALIHTSFPMQKGVYDRLWMAEKVFGGITYVEISNPDLRNKYKFDVFEAGGYAFEMHCFNYDINLLIDILTAAVEQIKRGTVTQLPNTDNLLLGS